MKQPIAQFPALLRLPAARFVTRRRVVRLALVLSCLIAAGVSLSPSVFRIQIKPQDFITPSVPSAPVYARHEMTVESPADLQQASDGQVFGFLGAESVGVTAAPGDQADELLRSMTLVGIISGDNPQAVIEDKAREKAYYLTVGQSLNGFTLEEIAEARVMLSFDGKRFELHL